MTNRVNKRLIYDVGMHIGQDTEFYLRKGFDVVAIEANPILANQQAKRFQKMIDAKKLKIINMGIGQKEGKQPFTVNDTLSEWSSFDKEIGSRSGKYHVIEVEMTTLEKVINDHGIPYYLKIDIEGSDYIALQGIHALVEKPKYVSVENGQKHFLDLFREEGYVGYKFVNQKNVSEQVLPWPAREGRYVRHRFQIGSSGAFGDEIPGKWLPYGDILKEIRMYWENPERNENIHGWYDLHAKSEYEIGDKTKKEYFGEDEGKEEPSRIFQANQYSEEGKWKNGVSLKDARKFFIIIERKQEIPLNKGDKILLNKSGETTVIDVCRFENADNSSVFVQTDVPLDPIEDGYPNKIMLQTNTGTFWKQCGRAVRK